MSFICLGDFGTGEIGQYCVSKLMQNIIKNNNSKFILGLGDNFYPDGIKRINDKKFRYNFELPYSNLPKNIKFYNCLGNHDYRGIVEHQINYSNKNPQWVLKDNYYKFSNTINNVKVDFFAIDTNFYLLEGFEIDGIEQEEWIIKEIKKSNAQWIILFGHHPFKSSGFHGNATDKLKQFYDNIVSLNKVDLILSGHDHDIQHINNKNYPHCFVSGTGGKTRYMPGVIRKYLLNNELQYYSEKLGCLNIEVYKTHLNVNIYTTDYNLEHNLDYMFKVIK